MCIGLSVGLELSALVTLGLSAPKKELKFFSALFAEPEQVGWNPMGFKLAALLATVAFFAAALGIVARSFRMRRKGDRYSPALIAAMLISTVLIALFVFTQR